MRDGQARQVAVIRTGTANLASVLAALRREGVAPVLVSTPAVLEDFEAAVLPGVGAFGAAMAALKASGMDRAIVAHVQAGRALLAICLGLQVLFEASEESAGVAGLGIVPGLITRFGAGPRVPQMGWNLVTPVTANASGQGDDGAAGESIIEPGYAYFANSYCARSVPQGWRYATSEHGESFVAVMQRGRVAACQFHPELSGEWGRRLMVRWLGLAGMSRCEREREVAPC